MLYQNQTIYKGDDHDSRDSIPRPLAEGSEGLEFDVLRGAAWAAIDITGITFSGMHN